MAKNKTKEKKSLTEKQKLKKLEEIKRLNAEKIEAERRRVFLIVDK